MRCGQVGLLIAGLMLCAAARGAERVPDAPLGVPDDAAVARATKLIKQTFATEYGAAKTLPLQAALAQRLLKEAVDTKEDLAARYVLLCEARDLAARAAEAPI